MLSAQENTTIAIDPRLNEKKFNILMRMVHSQITTSYTLEELKLRFTHYGCHCFPDDDPVLGPIMNGKGNPVDEIDIICRANSRCVKCLEIDFPNCDIHGEKYRWNLNNGVISCHRNTVGTGG